MKIAILGWGSLLWDKHLEFDRHIGDWLAGGPYLKLEFSRVSKSRAGALTLVIDETHGANCQVSYALSKRINPRDAICDLRCREGTILKSIGYHFSDCSSSGEPVVSNGIGIWMKTNGIDVAVWTGLPSNFQNIVDQPFSIPTALTYLSDLPSEGKAKAAEYVWRAPEFIQTPLRSALEVVPWFAASVSESGAC